jgi:hypothetical protein
MDVLDCYWSRNRFECSKVDFKREYATDRQLFNNNEINLLHPALQDNL